MKFNSLSLVLLMLTCVQVAVANDMAARWTVSGFGTLGMLGSDSRELGFTRDRTQVSYYNSLDFTTDSRLGLQLDVNLSDRLHFTSQFVFRNHAGDFWEQNLEWGFLRWSVHPDINVRIGRIGADLFLLSDDRNVGFTYPWMRPPHEFYGNLPAYHFDGADLVKTINLGEGLLRLKVFAGYTQNELATDRSDNIEFIAPATGGNLIYETGNWRARIGYSYLSGSFATTSAYDQKLDLLNDPLINALVPNANKLSPYFYLKDSPIHFFSMGATYDDGLWLMHTEASYTNTNTVLAPSNASSYLSVGRRFGKFTLYSLYGLAYSFEKTVAIPTPLIQAPALDELYQLANHTLNENAIHEQSLSLGVRWDVFNNTAIKAQWSHYWFGRNGKDLWHTQYNDPSRQSNIWSIGIDFVF